ncbi:unnamed protein product [Prunus armeniaca]
MSSTRGAVLFKSTVRGPNSEAGPQIRDSPDLPLHALPLELLPPSVLRHPEELASNLTWAPERNENENAAGPTHCRNYWDFFSFFFWVPLSLGRASYGTAQTWLIYFQAL